MDKELRLRASESADRMTRGGMTLSAEIMQELIAEVERLRAENAEEATYIRFLEKELTRTQASSNGDLEQELGGETPQLRARHMLLAGETNN